MKATQLLKQQHREVETLFEAIEGGAGDIAALLEKLADSLVAHMTIEQRIFYPEVKGIDADLVSESFEEHAAAEMELERVMALDVSDPRIKARVGVLEEMILHHVKEEESALFPEVEKSLGADELESLGREMAEMFAEVMEEGYEGTLSKAPVTAVDETVPQELMGRPSAPSMA